MKSVTKPEATHIKYFQSPRAAALQFDRLSKMYRVDPEDVVRPIRLVEREGRMEGYEMEWIANAKSLGQISRMAKRGVLLRKTVLELAKRISSAFDILHSNGLYHEDVDQPVPDAPNYVYTGNILTVLDESGGTTKVKAIKLIDPYAEPCEQDACELTSPHERCLASTHIAKEKEIIEVMLSNLRASIRRTIS